MPSTVLPEEGGPLYHRVAGQIERLIAAGTLRPGDRIPSVRRLSRQLSVSVTTVLEAYRLLEDRRLVQATNVIEHPPLAAAEDFSYFLQRRPGAFIFVGAANQARGIDAPHHSPRFDIDEAALPRGAELLVRLALD